MACLIKRHTYLAIIISFIMAMVVDYKSGGTHYQLYFFPILVAGVTLRLRNTLLIATVAGILSAVTFHAFKLQSPIYDLMALARILFFILGGITVSALVEKETAKKDDLIRELSSHLDLNKTLHKLLLNDGKTAIEVINTRGKIVAWNEKAVEWSGISTAVGEDHLSIFGQSASSSNTLLLDTASTGKEYMDQEITIVFPDKNPVTALVTTYALRNEQNAVVGAMAVFRDITEKKLLERKMLQAEKFTALGQMAAGLAHEIRNPLTTVKGFLQLISPDNLTPKYSEYRELMLNEVNRTNKLISDFVLLASPSAPVFKEVTLVNLVDTIFELFQGNSLINNIRLLNQVTELPPVYLDCEQFKHLMLCLYNNSAEAMPGGGIFGIHAVEIGNNVQIQVWDTGSGIPQELLDRVFDPFFSTKEEGSGLGLAISYQIVKNHQGSISVSSRSGAGTTFTITLPLYHPIASDTLSVPA